MAAAARMTVADLVALGEDTRIELIDGELIHKAAPSGEHSGAQGLILSWLRRRFDRAPGGRWPGGWWIRPEIHIGYPSGDVHCPDLAGWRRERMPQPPRGWPIRTLPDWVCEVLSPGHEKRDVVDKMRVLHAAAVPHYWIVDRDERVLQIYRHAPAGYVLVRSASTGETILAEPFDAVPLLTDVILGDLDDEE